MDRVGDGAVAWLVTLRIRTRSASAGEEAGWQARAFSLINGDWYERYVGRVTPQKIADHVRDVDGQRDTWAIVHFATDITASQADGLTPSQVANALFSFNSIRRRVRGQ